MHSDYGVIIKKKHYNLVRISVAYLDLVRRAFTRITDFSQRKIKEKVMAISNFIV